MEDLITAAHQIRSCLALFDPSEYSGDILCKLTNILMIILDFLIGTEQHQKDIGGVDELRKLG